MKGSNGNVVERIMRKVFLLFRREGKGRGRKTNERYGKYLIMLMINVTE